MMRAGRIWAVAATLTVAGLVGAGCGDDDEGSSSTTGSTAEEGEPATRDDYVDAMREGDENLDFADEEEGRCVYEAFVDAYGPDELAAVGVSPDDLIAAGDFEDLGIEFSDAQADALYEGMDACLDVRSEVIDGMTEDSSAEEAACIEANMTDDLIERVVVASFIEGEDFMRSDPELASELGSTIMPCMVLDPDGS